MVKFKFKISLLADNNKIVFLNQHLQLQKNFCIDNVCVDIKPILLYAFVDDWLLVVVGMFNFHLDE